MFLLDDENNVHEIQDSHIICIEVSRPHIYYRTLHGKYRAPRTLVEFLKIYESMGFTQIDKKKLFCIPLADKVEKGNIYYDHLEYPVSRRLLPKVKLLMEDKNRN
jgi:hypothetical protein